MAKYWLVKSEPNTYSIDDLKRDRKTSWEGVRNYQARNLMKEMKKGDLALFYHSNANPPGVAGVARIVREAYPDDYQFKKGNKYYDEKATRDNPRWFMVDVGFVEKLARLVPLDELKTAKGLEDMVVTKRSRLSVQPATKKEFGVVVKLGGGKTKG